MSTSQVATKADIDEVKSSIKLLTKNTSAFQKDTSERFNTVDDHFNTMQASIDETLDFLRHFMQQTSDEFAEVRMSVSKIQNDMQSIMNYLDSIDKGREIDDVERIAIAHQLTQIQMWVQRASKKIGISFER